VRLFWPPLSVQKATRLRRVPRPPGRTRPCGLPLSPDLTPPSPDATASPAAPTRSTDDADWFARGRGCSGSSFLGAPGSY